MVRNRTIKIIGWIVILMFFLYDYYSGFKGVEKNLFIYPFNLADGSIYALVSFEIVVLAATYFLNIQYGIPRFLRRNKIGAYLLFILVLISIIILLEYLFGAFLQYLYDLPKNIKNLYGAEFDQLTIKRELDFSLWAKCLITLIFSLAIMHIQNIQSMLIEKTRMEKLISEKWKSELDTLKSQVNPHFLFNSLNHIYAIANRNGDTDTTEAIDNLSGLIRFMIYDSQKDTIPLSDEVAYIKDFIALQQARYLKEEVAISLKTKGDLSAVQISPLLIIPFVENAFKHGVLVHERSKISISLSVVHSVLYFEITNTKYTNPNNTVYSGIGIDNVKQRLELVYRERANLEITETEKEFKVNLCMELDEMYHN